MYMIILITIHASYKKGALNLVKMIGMYELVIIIQIFILILLYLCFLVHFPYTM